MSSEGNIFFTTENLAFSLPLLAVCGVYVRTTNDNDNDNNKPEEKQNKKQYMFAACSVIVLVGVFRNPE